MCANKEELYHKSRIAFAELSQTKLVITEGDTRGHKQWLQEDYGVTDDKFEELVRGYIKDNRIVVYKGSDFRTANDEEVFDVLHKLRLVEPKMVDTYEIYSGVLVGEVGREWEPALKIR